MVRPLEKTTLDMTKFTSVKKIHTKIILAKGILELKDFGFLYYSRKHALICSGLYRFIFQSLYHQNLKLKKQ